MYTEALWYKWDFTRSVVFRKVVSYSLPDWITGSLTVILLAYNSVLTCLEVPGNNTRATTKYSNYVQ